MTSHERTDSHKNQRKVSSAQESNENACFVLSHLDRGDQDYPGYGDYNCEVEGHDPNRGK
jgi:hypothetical protein